jgi:hypothetical protein
LRADKKKETLGERVSNQKGVPLVDTSEEGRTATIAFFTERYCAVLLTQLVFGVFLGIFRLDFEG